MIENNQGKKTFGGRWKQAALVPKIGNEMGKSRFKATFRLDNVCMFMCVLLYCMVSASLIMQKKRTEIIGVLGGQI